MGTHRTRRERRATRAAAGLLLVLLGGGCKMRDEPSSGAQPDPQGSAATTTQAARAPGQARAFRMVTPPPGVQVAAAVVDERTRAPGRAVLVYAGATWCEPCQRFHEAAERGELDRDLPDVTLLTFDMDQDRDRLRAAGYTPAYIPMFALPGADGRASSRQIEGSVKGEEAVRDITPRLKQLLGR